MILKGERFEPAYHNSTPFWSFFSFWSNSLLCWSRDRRICYSMFFLSKQLRCWTEGAYSDTPPTLQVVSVWLFVVLNPVVQTPIAFSASGWLLIYVLSTRWPWTSMYMYHYHSMITRTWNRSRALIECGTLDANRWCFCWAHGTNRPTRWATNFFYYKTIVGQ